jgi:hypothetical protein
MSFFTGWVKNFRIVFGVKQDPLHSCAHVRGRVPFHGLTFEHVGGDTRSAFHGNRQHINGCSDAKVGPTSNMVVVVPVGDVMHAGDKWL